MNHPRIRAFIPARVDAPGIPVVQVDGSLPVLGAVRMPRGCARGVVCGGKVVAWAVAREPDAQGRRHITVETDAHHRRRGYARACLQALVRDVPGPLLYLCDARNAASAATALSAGFVEIPYEGGTPYASL